MTIEQIRQQVSRVKPLSRSQLFRYIRALKIKPLGVRQRPQQYPAATPQKITVFLGLSTDGAPSMLQLRAEKSKALKARRAA